LEAKKLRHIKTTAAQEISRVFRGHKGRRVRNQYFRTRTDAVIRLQAAYCGMITRKETTKLRFIMTMAANKIQAGWMGRRGRMYAKDKRRVDSAAARKIQRVSCT